MTPNETITNGDEDPKSRFLRDKLTEAINNLAPLFESDCTREKALKCWDKAFNTDFFIGRLKADAGLEAKSALAAPSVLAAGMVASAAAAAESAVRKEGGGRYA